MQSGDNTLASLAEAVADGSEVDWAQAESNAPDDERLAIQQLRRLAAVGVAARARASSWGPFELRDEIGSGVFGTVYRAWDTRLEREVALKLLHDDPVHATIAPAIVKEGRVLAHIRHANVVTVFGADSYGGRAGILMEFVTGRTLKDIVRDQGPFGAHEAAVLGRDLCRALAAVHQQGFVHRDIKAQNVMREAGGRTVLMDFGTGIASAGLDAAVPALGGTPVYLAPELLEGQAPTTQSDLYALGVLLFFLVSGEFPVVAASLQGFRTQHATGRRKLLGDVRPDVPDAFVRAVDAALAPNPADRPASAGAMQMHLEAALVESAAPRPSLGVAHVFSRWRVAALFAAMTLAGAIAFAVWPNPIAGNSVAILPFRDLTSGVNESEYLTDGITDDLVAHLSTLQDLHVISGNSLRRYRDEQRPETEIGAALGVATVLDGSVRQFGDRVRIVSRLVDAKTGEQLWSESFERNLTEVADMQSEVARKIAVALKVQLSEPAGGGFGFRRGASYEAFKLYSKGRYRWKNG
jgi:serine/threonine protein kinase